MSPLIVAHMALALTATVCGAFAIWARQGQRQRPALHRAAGLAFVVCLLGAALTATFLRDRTVLINWHGLTPVHALIPLTVLGMARALWHLRQRNVQAHRRLMIRIYTGACVIAGLFTLLPNRLLGHMLWSALGLV